LEGLDLGQIEAGNSVRASEYNMVSGLQNSERVISIRASVLPEVLTEDKTPKKGQK